MADEPAVNQTMQTFGYPHSVVAEHDHWVVLLRPQQATLGALVLVCREAATAFSGISPAAFAELGSIVPRLEGTLRRALSYDKINYLMLMMVDPHVHFHVLPRYSGPRSFAGVTFADPGWPRAPDLARATEIPDACRSALLSTLRDGWRPE